MSTENQTPDLTNVSELAREVAQNIFWEVPLMERTTSKLAPFIQSALSKLVAEKDAEIDAALTDRARFEQGVESLKAQLDALRMENEKFTRLFIGVCNSIGDEKGERLFENAKKIVGEDNNALRAEVERLTKQSKRDEEEIEHQQKECHNIRQEATQQERQRWQNVHADFERALIERTALRSQLESLQAECERLRKVISMIREHQIMDTRQRTHSELRAAIDAAMQPASAPSNKPWQPNTSDGCNHHGAR